jgi:phage shock protein C
MVMTGNRKLYRSRHGEFMGVCQGFADWRELPVGPIRLLVIVIALSTGIFPILTLYILAGIFMPLEPTDREFFSRDFEEDVRGRYRKNRHHTVHDIKEEFDNLKQKVSQMEDEVFDKEKEWDKKFHSTDKR